MDLLEYREQLERRLGKVQGVMRIMIHKAQQSPKRIVFPEGEQHKILRAAQILIDEKIATPILLGNEAAIREGLAVSSSERSIGDHRGSGKVAESDALCRGIVPSAPAQRCHANRSEHTDPKP